jgi:hypothetical protein
LLQTASFTLLFRSRAGCAADELALPFRLRHTSAVAHARVMGARNHAGQGKRD